MSLRLGNTAPDFRLRDQHGRITRLSSLVDERPVAVVFFPFVFSGVCTSELRDLRDSARQISQAGAGLVAVSCDPMYSLRAYADQDRIDFPLLSDFWPHGEVSAAWGALDDERGCPTRSTFLLDRAGVLRWSVHNPVGEARRVSDLIAAVEALAVPPLS